MQLIDTVSKTIQDYNLFEENSKLLITVSGGVDSMVLLDVLLKSVDNIVVAHCNFGLRDEEANLDQDLVKAYCAEKSIQCEIIKFDTKGFKKELKISTQEAARILRYQWFEQLIDQLKLDYIVTAHHEDDAIETMFINLIRGTGLRGLSALALKEGKTIRPMLYCTKKEILDYAKTHKIIYREDKSNDSNDYLRNKLRNDVLPYLYDKLPNLEKTIGKSIDNFRFANRLFKDKIQQERSQYFTDHKIAKQSILNQFYPVLWLYELLAPYHFNNEQIRQIIASIQNTGAIFYSRTHQLLVDRDWLLLEVLKSDKVKYEVIINKITHPTQTDHTTILVDADKLYLPLSIKYFEEGDIFIPKGFKNSQKLSLFFKKQKVNRFDKQSIPLIVDSKGTIIWVHQLRVSGNVCIDVSSKNFAIIGLQTSENL